jgi:hypothetical protein
MLSAKYIPFVRTLIVIACVALMLAPLIAEAMQPTLLPAIRDFLAPKLLQIPIFEGHEAFFTGVSGIVL